MLFLLASLGTVTSAYTLEPCVYRTDQFGYSTPCLCGLIFFLEGWVLSLYGLLELMGLQLQEICSVYLTRIVLQSSVMKAPDKDSIYPEHQAPVFNCV